MDKSIILVDRPWFDQLSEYLEGRELPFIEDLTREEKIGLALHTSTGQVLIFVVRE